MSRGVRLEDLPPAMREKAMAALDKPAPTKKRGKGNRATGVATSGWCVACREHFTSTAAWERHSDETGHRRFELLADPNETTRKGEG